MSILSLSHGQAFVERGFSSSKWILGGNRESLLMESFKTQNTIKETCEKYNGADKYTSRLAQEKREKNQEERRKRVLLLKGKREKKLRLLGRGK